MGVRALTPAENYVELPHSYSGRTGLHSFSSVAELVDAGRRAPTVREGREHRKLRSWVQVRVLPELQHSLRRGRFPVSTINKPGLES